MIVPAPGWLLAGLLAIVAAGVVHAASPPLVLNIVLDPGERRLEAVAFVRPELRDFRFDLHESLAVSAAVAAGKRLRITREDAVWPGRGSRRVARMTAAAG